MHFQNLLLYQLNIGSATSTEGIFQNTLPIFPMVGQFWKFLSEVAIGKCITTSLNSGYYQSAGSYGVNHVTTL